MKSAFEIRSSVGSEPPVFSVCIPQFNRTSFLIETCRSLITQKFKSFEVCISDDCSTDGREDELCRFLENSGFSFVYRRQARNRRYDGNLRESIALSTGQFCFLLGNDDGLASEDTLAGIYETICRHTPVSVALTNYQETGSGKLFRRVRSTGIAGSGPETAIRAFRHFAFVSGVILDGEAARNLATEKWDGSEMYQMFLGCRMIAAGGRLLTIDQVCIRKDLQVPGERVDSYALQSRITPCPIRERRLPMGRILSLVADSVAPFQSGMERERGVVSAAAQLFFFTYAFWLVEFRRVQSWRYAAGVYLGLRPRNTVSGVPLSAWRRLQVRLLFLWTGLGGLIVPVKVFRILQDRLYALAKR